nr:hypothetical protein Iba_chr06aCG12570 [Ipomoea batatas]
MPWFNGNFRAGDILKAIKEAVEPSAIGSKSSKHKVSPETWMNFWSHLEGY